MKQFAAFLGVISLVFSYFAQAQVDVVSAVQADNTSELEREGSGYTEEGLRLLTVMQGYFPLKQVVGVEEIAEGRLYQVRFASGLILYALPGGEYFVAGNIFKAAPEGVVDLSKQLQQKENARLLAALEPRDYLVLSAIDSLVEDSLVEDSLVEDSSAENSQEADSAALRVEPGQSEGVGEDVAAAEQSPKELIYVFVDIDCYYCQFQHQESALLTAAGVEVRYLSYNRQKPGSSAYHKVRRTWCSQDPQAALDMMMQGRSLAVQSCTEGLMDKHIELAKKLAIKRLPAVVTPDGRVTEGLLRAAQIFNLLGIDPPAPAEADLDMEVVEAGSALSEASPSSF
jgi:hypothetical protein